MCKLFPTAGHIGHAVAEVLSALFPRQSRTSAAPLVANPSPALADVGCPVQSEDKYHRMTQFNPLVSWVLDNKGEVIEISAHWWNSIGQRITKPPATAAQPQAS